MNTPNHDLIETLDSDDYDTESALIDDRNNNFSPDQVEDYRKEYIVHASLINGQFTQARQQCAEYGLNYAQQRHAAGLNPWPN